MIARVIAWAMTLRGAGWFMPGPAGRFPMPDAWQGWVAFGALVVALAVAAALPPDFSDTLRDRGARHLCGDHVLDVSRGLGLSAAA